MKRLLLVITITSATFAQEDIYETSYRQALEDSVITEGEQKMLDALQQSLKLDEDVVLVIQKRVGEKPDTVQRKSQEGRWLIAMINMTLGNGLYGWAVPYPAGSDIKTGRHFRNQVLNLNFIRVAFNRTPALKGFLLFVHPN